MTILSSKSAGLTHRLSKPSGTYTPHVDMSRVASIILGGGQGSRLFPLTISRCKPAICFGGRYRLVDVPVSNSLNAGCHKIFILTQFLSSSLHQHIIRTYHFDAFSPGFIELISAEQKPDKSAWFKGTADAVRQSLDYFVETPADYFLILSGDQLYSMDFRKMVRFAQETEADVVVAAQPVGEKDAKRMGLLKIDKDNLITDFCEKPQEQHLLDQMRVSEESFRTANLPPNPETPYIGSMGIYLFKREALINLLQDDPRDDFGKHLIPTKVEQGSCAAFLYDGYWEDIGTVASFHEANIALTRPVPRFNCYDEANPIFTSHYNLPGPKIRDAHIKQSIICEGSFIEGQEISSSILGPRSVVRPGTIIRNSYIMGNDFYKPPIHSKKLPSTLEIGEDCLLENVILDKYVRLGKGVQLTNKQGLTDFDGENIFIRDGIIVVPRGADLPNGFSL